jgi:nucleotide-binding universal stress UspA family protein
MIERIVVPLDGSEHAEQALLTAEEIAATTGASITLVRIVEVVAPGEREPGMISYLDEHRVAAAQDYLEAAAAKLRLGRPVAHEVDLAADVSAGILGLVRAIAADLVIMTSHARSWPAAGALGSVAARLLAEAPCPVLVLGPGCLGHAIDGSVEAVACES